jgi:hypothetical protein
MLSSEARRMAFFIFVGTILTICCVVGCYVAFLCVQKLVILQTFGFTPRVCISEVLVSSVMG